MMMVSDSLRRGAGRCWSKFSWGVDGWLTCLVEALPAETKPVLADSLSTNLYHAVPGCEIRMSGAERSSEKMVELPREQECRLS